MLIAKFPVQPWKEFLELNRFGMPPYQDLEHLGTRISANIDYYSGQQVKGFAIISLVILYFAGGMLIALYYLALALLACIIHATTRKRSVKSKINFALRSTSSNSLSASISKVAEQLVSGDNVKLNETVKYDANVHQPLRTRSASKP